MTDISWDQIHVLVADDDETFLRLMESYLKKLGCPAKMARNGKEAVNLAKSEYFDICFMDILMPEMNGIEAALIIREEISSKLPIIAVTSSTMIATKEKCMESGMNDYVVKPVPFDILKDILRRYALQTPQA